MSWCYCWVGLQVVENSFLFEFLTSKYIEQKNLRKEPAPTRPHPLTVAACCVGYCPNVPWNHTIGVHYELVCLTLLQMWACPASQRGGILLLTDASLPSSGFSSSFLLAPILFCLKGMSAWDSFRRFLQLKNALSTMAHTAEWLKTHTHHELIESVQLVLSCVRLHDTDEASPVQELPMEQTPISPKEAEDLGPLSS